MYMGRRLYLCWYTGLLMHLWRLEATLEYHPLSPSYVLTGLPTAPGASQLARSAGQQVLKFSCLLFPVCDYRSTPPCPVFSVGARVPISGLYTQKGNNFITKPSLQPSRSFQYFKDVDPLFLPLHCFSQNNKEKSISCERRE